MDRQPPEIERLGPLYSRVLLALTTVLVAEVGAAFLLTVILPTDARPWLKTSLHVLFILAALVPGLWIVGIHPWQVATRERALSKGLLDTMTDGVVVTDDRGIIQFCNTATERMFGHDRWELAGQNVKVLVPPPFREQHDDLLMRATGADRTRVLGARRETVGQRKDGTIVPLDMAVREEGFGRRRWYIAVISDVTERKRVSRSLKEAKQAADAANHAKSEFLANMSHEIRTPMTAILGFTDLLRKGADRIDESERQDYLDTIYTSGRHLLDLINDILDLSKIEAGQMKFEQIACAPHQVIAEVVSVLRVRAREKGLFLEYEWSGKVPETIRSDPARLRQLLINLVGNAVKFTQAGGVRIVAGLAHTGARPQLTIEVIDTGIGIPPDKLDSIFDPFVQADTSVTREFGGTGLGLAICRRIVEALGGDLTVRSRPGEGSVFAATIDTGPLEGVKLLAAPPSGEIHAKNPSAEIRTSTLPPARVLLVDDGGTNRKLIGLVLRRAGAEVVDAENGSVGVELATSGRFDLILMDMQMPVMDGYTATRTLRRLGIQTPIIALTAHAMKGDEAKCRSAGCTGYLAKPIDADLLLDTVAAAVGDAGLEAARAHSPPAQPPADHLALVSTLPMDDPEFREIAEEFSQRLGEQLVAMKHAWESGDVAELGALAHWLKGAGGTVGFPAFTEPAEHLEQLAKSEQTGQIDATIAEIAELAGRIAVPGATPVPSNA